MKKFILILFVFTIAFAKAQTKNDTIKTTFAMKIDGVPKDFEYLEKGKSLVRFSCFWKTRENKYSTTTTQTFVLENKKLTTASESIVSVNNDDKEDIHGWMGNYKFLNGKLIDQITHGHGKSETDDWDPEKEVLENYKTILKRINEYRNKAKK
jgi:hypothetical protein